MAYACQLSVERCTEYKGEKTRGMSRLIIPILLTCAHNNRTCVSFMDYSRVFHDHYTGYLSHQRADSGKLYGSGSYTFEGGAQLSDLSLAYIESEHINNIM